MTDTETLLPCPFCGGNEIESLTKLNFVCCQGCGASLEDSEPSARALWNTRAALPPAAPAFEACAWRWRTLPRFREGDDNGEWSLVPVKPDFINPHHHEVEPLYAVAAPALDRAATPSDFERAFADACDEIGCAHDNEALLQAIADLKARK